MTGQTTAGAAPARTLTAADPITPAAASTGALRACAAAGPLFVAAAQARRWSWSAARSATAAKNLRLPVSILEPPVRSTSESGRIGWPLESFEGDAMRKIVAGLMISVDGVVEAPETLLFPVVAGHGKRLFGDGDRATGLTLARSEAFSTGVVQLVYHAAGNA